MSRAVRNALWEQVKQAFNENPQGIPMEDLLDKVPIKPGFIKDNPHLIIMDYVCILRSAGFLKVKHVSVSETFFRRINVPIWKIPESITIKEVDDLSKQPKWILWFMYPEGNIL